MQLASKDAEKFVLQLAELTKRLAAKNIVVSRLHADWSVFGSWELQAQSGVEAERYREGLSSANPLGAIGPEVVRFFWDGRDHYLSVDTSPTQFCSAPNEWKNECNKGFSKFGDDLLLFVEEYLTRRFGA